MDRRARIIASIFFAAIALIAVASDVVYRMTRKTPPPPQAEKGETDPEKIQFAKFIQQNADDPTDLEIVDWGRKAGGLRTVRFRCKRVCRTPAGRFQMNGPVHRGGACLASPLGSTVRARGCRGRRGRRR